MMSYFELIDDESLRDRWHLGELTDAEGKELDCRDFTNGMAIDKGPPLRLSLRNEDRLVNVALPLTVEVQVEGTKLELTLGAFDTIVATKAVAESLSRICGNEFQRFPISIAGRKHDFELLNCTRRIDCIDTTLSEIEWWTKSDRRPDKIGHPRMITQLVIDPRRTEGAHFFRLRTWEVSIIVSEAVKNILERDHVSGVSFRPCSF